MSDNDNKPLSIYEAITARCEWCNKVHEGFCDQRDIQAYMDSQIIEMAASDRPPLDETVFRKLCEEYADAVDGVGGVKSAQEKLLRFCHQYAYKINGVEPW